MTFQPHPLLRGPHRQTIFGAFGRHAPVVVMRPERFELSDGDFVDLLHSGPPEDDHPRAILLHGLGGSAQSRYIRAMNAALVAAGWAVTAFQFRGAAGPNRRARTYHSGDTGDIAEVAQALRARAMLPSATTARPANRHPAKLIAVGFSMGGNVVLKLLGEQGANAVFDAAVAVSVPFRLAVCSAQLATGASRLYGHHLVSGRQRSLRAIRHLVAPLIDYERAMAATDFRTLDSLVTAPLNGFTSADDYYARSSSLGFIRHVQRPTLVLHAHDDPFMTPEAVPTTSDLSPSITFELHPHGGHVGFIERGAAGLPRSFIERRVVAWLRPFLSD